jgi:hypothetical protein
MWQLPLPLQAFRYDHEKSEGVILAAVCAFAASCLCSSPILFGMQLIALRGVAAIPKWDALKVPAELLRNLLPAFVIRRPLARQEAGRLRAALGFAAILWLAFPLTLLSGQSCGKMCRLSWG